MCSIETSQIYRFITLPLEFQKDIADYKVLLPLACQKDAANRLKRNDPSGSQPMTNFINLFLSVKSTLAH